MKLDYKRELENAAKNMILIHEPDLLIRMIVRMIVQKVKVSHAGILLHNLKRESFILTISRGRRGLKIPAGFARMDLDNPLIRFFSEYKHQRLLKEPAVVFDEVKKCLKKKGITIEAKTILKKILYQMEIFEAIVSIPSYFRNNLLGILLLGKKNNKEKFKQEEIDFFNALASDVAMAIRNAQLFHDLELELDRRKRLFIHTTIALATAIDAKDHYTHGHTERVTSLSLEIAKQLSQKNKETFNKKFLEDLHIASLLHDIGKIGVPESVLNKEGSLNEQELKCMQRHSLIGVEILQPIKELKEAILGVRHHHERYDGSGYPDGLKGEDIPLVASIISVADSFDAMTTDRPYRKALTKKDAINEIERMSNKQFSSVTVSALVELYKEGKI